MQILVQKPQVHYSRSSRQGGKIDLVHPRQLGVLCVFPRPVGSSRGIHRTTRPFPWVIEILVLFVSWHIHSRCRALLTERFEGTESFLPVENLLADAEHRDGKKDDNNSNDNYRVQGSEIRLAG